MAKNLVIVESPAKVKTIKKFLGANYEVAASMGHVRDLPKSQMGIDVENDYEPKYITIRGKGELLAGLRKQVKKADKIYLATDPDREGEAISWHLVKGLNLEGKKVYRIAFNEITKQAVKEALKNQRELDMDLVDAQQARRVLDRMVGYKISPLLWAKVKRGLSAGRVQSVALRIICDREEEINAFVPEEYWNLEISFDIEGEKKNIVAKYYGTKIGKKVIGSEAELKQILKELKKSSYKISEIKKREKSKKSPLPFTTSTLQQEASKTLNFSTQKTMRLAQQLYEGVDIKGIGTIGLITYLRTDSTRISDVAKEMSREFIENVYGKEFLKVDEKDSKNNKKIQDAHEAIRPTDINLKPINIKESLSKDQLRLYQLIWKRFVASRMSNAIYESTSVTIENGEYLFKVSTSKLLFEGYRAVYIQADEEAEDSKQLLNNLNEDKKLSAKDIDSSRHFTLPPSHYTEASLVKNLEELGIGRPSTYAPTITTLLGRRYVAKENKNIYVTELGEIVNKIMKEAFPSIVNVNFTASLEALLDGIEEGNVQWKTVISNFYPDLEEAVEIALEKLAKIEIADEVSDEECDLCGRQMVIKYGPHGRFLACPGFPDCRNTKPYFEKIGIKCPKCEKEIVIRKTKKGRRYFGCEDIPECDFMVWQKPSEVKCEKCGSIMLEKGNKLVCSDDKCRNVIGK